MATPSAGTRLALLVRVRQRFDEIDCLVVDEMGKDISGPASTAEFILVWIRNTLALEELVVSTALLPAVAADPSLEVLGEPGPFPARADGALSPAWGGPDCGGDRELSAVDG